jgi:hypothetical protein
MTGGAPLQGPAEREVLISLPFSGRWLVQNSPARRIPSHGTDLLGGRYAIDFVGVDDRRRTSDHSDWRTLLSTEPPGRFFSYGRPVLAPGDGVVVQVHDGEPDHAARRSQVTLAGYALGQPARLRRGVAAVAGNHVIINLKGTGLYVGLAHLRTGSLRVGTGDEVRTGERIADCGNSGNSTQPHLHLQVMDNQELTVARGVPMAFRRFREWSRGSGLPLLRDAGMPAEGAVVEPLAPPGMEEAGGEEQGPAL